MAAMAVTLLASANPFFHYKEWKTPHGTYPFNDIRPEHYMPAFEEGIKQGLAEIDAIVNNPAAPTFKNTIEAYEKSGELPYTVVKIRLTGALKMGLQRCINRAMSCLPWFTT